jgi:hypothetical protein
MQLERKSSLKPLFNHPQCHPLTTNRWSDIERLFGEKVLTGDAGACGGESAARNLNNSRGREILKSVSGHPRVE